MRKGRERRRRILLHGICQLATWRGGRHKEYISALQSVGVKCVVGHFKEKRRSCKICGAQWLAHEERRAMSLLLSRSCPMLSRTPTIAPSSSAPTRIWLRRSGQSSNISRGSRSTWWLRPSGSLTLATFRRSLSSPRAGLPSAFFPHHSLIARARRCSLDRPTMLPRLRHPPHPRRHAPDSRRAGDGGDSIAAERDQRSADAHRAVPALSSSAKRSRQDASSSDDGDDARRSGRRSWVRRTASAWRQAAMRRWSPPTRTGGMERPSNSRGRV